MDPIKNFAFSTVVTAPIPAISGTSLGISTGDGTGFPDPAALGAYNVIVIPPGAQASLANAEIIRVSARTGDTFGTIARGQEGTSPRAIAVGDTVILAATAKWFSDLAAGVVDRQVFLSSGTWTKPFGARRVRVIAMGGGGGGGAGRRGADGSVRCGGGGGGASPHSDIMLFANDLPATVTVTVGAGGTGAVATATDDTNGANGGSGTASSFGTYVLPGAGPGAVGGTVSSGQGGYASAGITIPQGSAAGASASATGGAGVLAASHIYSDPWQAPAGAAGAGVTSANVSSIGAAGRNNPTGVQTSTSQAAGADNGGSATPVASPVSIATTFYTSNPAYGGGSGGSASIADAVPGGAGGTAQGYGAGGGGGGASGNGFASGAGGAGAPGIVIVESWT